MQQNLTYWRSVLREAERELDAATGRTTLNAAAQKLMRAKAALKALEEGVCLGRVPRRQREPTAPRAMLFDHREALAVVALAAVGFAARIAVNRRSTLIPLSRA